jgi:hypothetical protein
VPFFGGGSRHVSGGASFVHRSTDGFTSLLRRGYGALSGDKRNAGHGDPIPVHNELGQGWSAAVSSQETIVDTLLQPRLYLQNSEGNVLKYLRGCAFNKWKK